VHDLVLATWEASANAIEHAHAPVEEFVEIFAEIDDAFVRIRVKDSGTWAPQSERSDRGLGLQVMRAAVTTVSIDSKEDGTSVRIEKEIAAAGDGRSA
jgi:anti-sigma regulatory factor (Ser/Thr protein kinase)